MGLIMKLVPLIQSTASPAERELLHSARQDQPGPEARAALLQSISRAAAPPARQPGRSGMRPIELPARPPTSRLAHVIRSSRAAANGGALLIWLVAGVLLGLAFAFVATKAAGS